MAEPVKIYGLAAFNRSLRKVDKELPKTVRLALNEAAQAVIDKAAPQVPSRTGAARRSLKARSTRTEVRVGAGSTRVHYYPWLDFGGRVGRKKATKRPFYTDGRYLYPTYHKLKASGEFERILSAALVNAARQAGVEVS